MKELIDKIIYEPWPWWVGGPLIGLFVIALLLIEGKQLGISSSFQYLCAKAFPFKLDYLRNNVSANFWQFMFVIGLVVGGLITLSVIGDQNVAISQETQNTLHKIGLTDLSGFVPVELYNFSFRSVAILLGGGLLLGFGARYANGCTAGHAIMGCAQLAPSSLIATSCFFLGGLSATYVVVPLLF